MKALLRLATFIFMVSAAYADGTTGAKNPLLVLSNPDAYSIKYSVHRKCSNWFTNQDEPQDESYVLFCKKRFNQLHKALKKKYRIEFEDFDLYEKSFVNKMSAASDGFIACVKAENLPVCSKTYTRKFIF